MIYDLKEKQEFLEEVAFLTLKTWGKYNSKEEFKLKLKRKIKKIKEKLEENNKNYAKLILVENNTLIGFISIFEKDGEEETYLTPWYATMYVKEEYRKKAILKF